MLSFKVLNKFNVCWNNICQTVFAMHKCQSVKDVQWFCERLDCLLIIHSLKLKFYSHLCWSPNNVVSQCFNWFLYSSDFKDLCRDYDVIAEPSHLNIIVLVSFIYSVSLFFNYLSCILECTGLPLW